MVFPVFGEKRNQYKSGAPPFVCFHFIVKIININYKVRWIICFICCLLILFAFLFSLLLFFCVCMSVFVFIIFFFLLKSIVCFELSSKINASRSFTTHYMVALTRRYNSLLIFIYISWPASRKKPIKYFFSAFELYRSIFDKKKKYSFFIAIQI